MRYKNFVSRFVSVKTSATALLVASLMSLSTLLVQAQTTIPIPLEVPDYDYSGILTGIMAKCAIPIAAAIGIGLSFVVITLIYRKIKSFAR